MKNADLPPTNPSAAMLTAGRVTSQPAWPWMSARARTLGRVGCLLLLVAVFLGPLVQLTEHALHTEFDSYILLVPFASVYLLHLKAKSLPRGYSSSSRWTATLVTLGLFILALGWHLQGIREGNYLPCTIAVFLCWSAATGFLFLGQKWMSQAAFPLAFLIFIIPLPAQTIIWLENCSKVASAEVAGWLFELSGTPNLRDGLIFRLPNITIEVAPECSGIRSSLVLFITGLIAAHLFLRSFWRQALLVALVIPLGFLRNGLRIWTIGELCVYTGPHMIDSIIHRRGGPVFFALSLVPLLILIWWLRRGEALSQPLVQQRTVR